MKKILAVIIAIAVPVIMSAQAQIVTKKMKISDFPDKTTKVVLTGKAMFDSYLQSRVKSTWHISPYEFCTLSEFESLKKSPDYYFLMLVSSQYEKESEPGLEMLTVVKGGVGSEDGPDGMYEVISAPFRSADEPSGREYVFFSAVLDIIQTYIQDAIESDIDGYSGLTNYSLDMPKAKGSRVVFAKGDIAPEVSPAAIHNYFVEGMEIMDTDAADDLMYDAAENTLVSYVVVPEAAANGSFCYKYLIDAKTHKLFYFKKHKLTKKFGPGFLIEDLKKISASL